MVQIKVIFIFLFLSFNAHGFVHRNIEITGLNESEMFNEIKAGEYEPTDTFFLKSKENNYIKIRYQELKNKTDDQMMKSFKKNIVQYTLLYQERSSPYKGALTVSTGCNDKVNISNKIIKDEISTLASFETIASKNFLYGKCDGEEQSFLSKYYIVLCKKEQVLYDVRFYTRDKALSKSFKVKCIK